MIFSSFDLLSESIKSVVTIILQVTIDNLYFVAFLSCLIDELLDSGWVKIKGLEEQNQRLVYLFLNYLKENIRRFCSQIHVRWKITYLTINIQEITNVSIGAWKWNFPPIEEFMTDWPKNGGTDREVALSIIIIMADVK